MPKTKIEVKLEAFEGPLDLLLHLIEKNKVDIYDIPIGDITDQYMEYVERMKENDMDLASEFLVMAATLVSIKTRMLLPVEYDEEGEKIDPREEIVQRLIEYKAVKALSGMLEELRNEATDVWYGKPQPIDFGVPKPIEHDVMIEAWVAILVRMHRVPSRLRIQH